MPEDLLTRLQNLENSYYGEREQARQRQFFDTYGSRFSNNRGLGLAILNELDAQGIDTSAADEAVTQILDKLRVECSEILDSIKEVQQEAIQSAQKVEAIQNVVADAVASNPNASDPTPPVDEMTPPVTDNLVIDDMNPDAEFNPDDVPPEEPPVEDVPPEAPPVEDVPPEEPPAETPAEELPPNQVTSDERTKDKKSDKSWGEQTRDARVNRMRSKWNETRAQRKAQSAKTPQTKPDSWKPSSGILSAAREGR